MVQVYASDESVIVDETLEEEELLHDATTKDELIAIKAMKIIFFTVNIFKDFNYWF